jgi:hypothetical protein
MATTQITREDITIGLFRTREGAEYRAAYVNDCVLTGPEHASLSDDDLMAEAIAEAKRAEIFDITPTPKQMAATTYRISAGYLDSILATRGDLEHASLASALEALAAVTKYDVEDFVTDHADDGRIYVYTSQAAADAGDAGDRYSSLATISEKEEDDQ